MKKIILGLLSLVFITNLDLKTIKAENVAIDPSTDYILKDNSESENKSQTADLLLDKLFQKADVLKNQLDLQDLAKKIDLLAQQIKQTSEAKPAPVAQGKKSALSKVFNGTINFYKFILDKSDKLVSKKGLIALLITFGPLVYLYSKHINPKTLPTIIHEVAHAAGSGAAEAGAAAAKGALQGGLVEVVKNNKMTAAKVVGVWFGLSTLKEVITQTTGGIGQKLAPKLINFSGKAFEKALLTLPLLYHFLMRRHINPGTLPQAVQIINID